MTEFAPAAQRYGEIGFCPRCGSPYGESDFRHPACVFVCSRCGFDFYQNPVPSAVAVVVDAARADSVLLIRRRTPPHVGRWCVPGGFLAYGESSEQAAVRETREEAGIAVNLVEVLRVGLVAYPYRGREMCILEVGYLAHPVEAMPGVRASSGEASEMALVPAAEILAAPQMLAFPEQLDLIRAYCVKRLGLVAGS